MLKLMEYVSNNSFLKCWSNWLRTTQLLKEVTLVKEWKILLEV
jgi:hypothetical protein